MIYSFGHQTPDRIMTMSAECPGPVVGRKRVSGFGERSPPHLLNHIPIFHTREVKARLLHNQGLYFSKSFKSNTIHSIDNISRRKLNISDPHGTSWPRKKVMLGQIKAFFFFFVYIR